MNRAESQASSRAVDSLINYETVKYFGNEAHEQRRYVGPAPLHPSTREAICAALCVCERCVQALPHVCHPANPNSA